MEALERVLKATSHLISYAQGMNYIGAIFLLEVILQYGHNPTASQPHRSTTPGQLLQRHSHLLSRNHGP
jgi:hypothetical protein